MGFAVDSYASPVSQVGSIGVRRDAAISTAIADGLDLRERNLETLDELEKSSLDFYSYLRSVTQQARRAALAEATGQPDPCQAPAEDLVDPGAPSAPAAPPPPAATPLR